MKNNETKHLNILSTAVIGCMIIAIILTAGTFSLGRTADHDTKEAVRNVSLLYLSELATRREQVVSQILDEYTNVTGKSPMLPLWTFGTWMSRITYFSQEEGLDIAKQLRKHRIPADVIHFDTGWFGVDWQCDYEFAKDRFKDPVGMLKQLKKDGFHTCLWQLPYFTPKNRYFHELVDGGMQVKNGMGGMPYEDVVLDLSNPITVNWYQGKIANLIKQGVSGSPAAQP